MDYITGASGVLGTKLHRLLLAESRDVRAIPHQLLPVTHLEPYEHFYFLSTYGNMSFHKEDEKILQANILDLIHVLSESNFEDGIRSFVFVSSSSVMRKIQTMYSRTKMAAEEILLSFMEKYDAPICIVRPLSITGVGDQEEHLIPTLIRSCLTGEKMPFVPDAYHDYIDGEDVAEGIIALSKRHAKGVFQLGTGTQYSNQEVREIVEKCTGKKANIQLVKNMRPFDSKEWVCTNFKARQYGWTPQKTLRQIVKEMVEAYE